MKRFFIANKRVFLIIFAVAILATVLLLAGNFSHYAVEKRTSRLAQVISVETELLKQWQQSHGLKGTLAYNSFGLNVVLLQKMLSQDSNIYPEKIISGYYGNLTRKAVLRFQAEYNLPKTGIVDVATKNKLNKVFLQFLCPEQTTIYPEFLLRKVTRQRPLPLDYVPPSLEDISGKVRTIGVNCARSDVVPYLIAMFRDAKQDGVYLAVTSGYRKPEIQQYLFDFWTRLEGNTALDAIAEPGKSEHQLGTAFDFTDASIGYKGVSERFANSKGGKWLAQNAHKYGFVMSYPRDKQKITGYEYEPWHWRFVGVNVATALYKQGITFNEFFFNKQKPFPKPSLNSGLNITAKAVFSMYIDRDGGKYILLEKNKDWRLPIASLTKLITALVASDMFRPSDIVVVSQNALNNKGSSGKYIAGENFLFKDALHALLISSHNEIAVSMAEQVGSATFLRQMNRKARQLGLANTHFINVTGLDPEIGEEEINYSTVSDVAKLLRYIFENRTDIFSILEKSKYQFTDIQGVRKINLQTTNKLIANRNSALRVAGGKTGETSRAKMNLAIVSDAPSPADGYIISVIIGSENSFQDMRQLLNYISRSFVW